MNGKVLGNSTDQFLRLKFAVGSLLKPTGNTLVVDFIRSISTHGRFMACSGGWDWAPYSDLRSGEGHQMLTKGIWRSVYLVAVPAGSAAILHAVPTTHFVSGRGGVTWPVTPLADDGSSHFTVNTSVYFWSKEVVAGTLTVTGEWGSTASAKCILPAGDGACVVPVLPANAVKLWWPRGLGPQQMYNVTASFAPSSSAAAVAAAATTAAATRRIGFRLAAVVTINDTSPEAVKRAATAEGTGNHTLMLRVNGAAIAARGANMIPMELLEGRIVPGMHTNLVASAAAANFNTIRVWGGGI